MKNLHAPPLALSPEERAAVSAVLHSDRFLDETPYQVYATLLDEGFYHCPIATMYRILRQELLNIAEGRNWPELSLNDIHDLQRHWFPERFLSDEKAVAFLKASGGHPRLIRYCLEYCKTRGEFDTYQTMLVQCPPNPNSYSNDLGGYSVLFRDIATGKELRKSIGHLTWIRSIDYSPDGSLLAVGSNDPTIRMIDTATGKEIYCLEGHADWIRSVDFSPDGKIVASCSDDRTVRLWDVSAGK